MTIVKISDLVELTNPADGDELVIVDVSEPLDIDKTKKITSLNLLASKISKSIFTAVGDILYATGLGTPAVLAKPAADSVLKMTSAGVPSWKALTELVSTLIYRRQGGSSTDWQTHGTTTYTPGTSTKIQTGVRNCSVSNGGGSFTTITFPTAFTYKPSVFVSRELSPLDGTDIWVESITNTGFTIYAVSTEVGSGSVVTHWMAIGE